jgi:DNA-binding transcriptional MerR regulator
VTAEGERRLAAPFACCRLAAVLSVSSTLRKAGIDVYVNVNYELFIMSVAAPPAAAAAKNQASRDAQRIYSIAELSREFAITPRTIRFYEDEGMIKPRRQGLTRLYSAGDRARLGWILRGKRLGFSLAEIRELLDLYQVDRTGVQQMRELLRRSRLHITDLEKKRRDLDAHINEFKEVETQVSAELRQRGVDPEGDD